MHPARADTCYMQPKVQPCLTWVQAWLTPMQLHFDIKSSLLRLACKALHFPRKMGSLLRCSSVSGTCCHHACSKSWMLWMSLKTNGSLAMKSWQVRCITEWSERNPGASFTFVGSRFKT